MKERTKPQYRSYSTNNGLHFSHNIPTSYRPDDISPFTDAPDYTETEPTDSETFSVADAEPEPKVFWHEPEPEPEPPKPSRLKPILIKMLVKLGIIEPVHTEQDEKEHD